MYSNYTDADVTKAQKNVAADTLGSILNVAGGKESIKTEVGASQGTIIAVVATVVGAIILWGIVRKLTNPK